VKVALLAACVSPAGGGISEIVGQLDRSLVAFDGVEVAEASGCTTNHATESMNSMRQVRLRTLLRGLSTLLLPVASSSWRSTGGTCSSRYCYSVWLRHLIRAHDAGLNSSPDAVAELGPGDSLGIGIAALLSGATSYAGFDAVRYGTLQGNLVVLDELVGLFHRRERIPGPEEFPEVTPLLGDYAFPGQILTSARLGRALDGGRIRSIRLALSKNEGRANGVQIKLHAPWDTGSAAPDSVDMVYSQAVLEHLNDPKMAYSAMYRWLRPGGFMSHAIDYRSHASTRDWNGHWTVSDAVWRAVVGRRPFWINRLPHSAHMSLIEQAGFRVRTDERVEGLPLPRHKLASRFAGLSDVDLRTMTAFVQAVKPKARQDEAS